MRKTCNNCKWWKKGITRYPRKVKKWWQIWIKSKPKVGLCRNSFYEKHHKDTQENYYCRKWMEGAVEK